MKISVLGAGAWGTALAMAASARHDTLLWTRDTRQAELMQAQRRNARYLPEVALPAQLRIGTDHDAALRHAQAGLLVIATPMAALRERLAALPPGMPALWLCKGFEAGSGALGHEIAAEVRPAVAAGVLSGPSFALEVARGQPTALVAASADAALCEAAVQAFHSDTLRVYRSADPVGVEVGGAVKNVLAIATGLVDGLAAREDPPQRPGLNARAALVTRGLAEMTRLGVALGARAETFMGLSGLGDLVLTATGDLSRNRRVGLLLAQGLALPDILAQLGHVAEGVYSASTVLARADRAQVQMPIAQAVVEVLAGRLQPGQAMQQLMSREATSES
ncbi:MAG: NAD(P)-dependent glycerol-3-phosphate dehydrogenase [Rubrivivax sp.]|nr:NAD(P)-dependent glycerol-3-phosphate dehydrogenase [Rubrivivax sp.]